LNSPSSASLPGRRPAAKWPLERTIARLTQAALILPPAGWIDRRAVIGGVAIIAGSGAAAPSTTRMRPGRVPGRVQMGRAGRDLSDLRAHRNQRARHTAAATSAATTANTIANGLSQIVALVRPRRRRPIQLSGRPAGRAGWAARLALDTIWSSNKCAAGRHWRRDNKRAKLARELERAPSAGASSLAAARLKL
jgi:hypothetical protein